MKDQLLLIIEEIYWTVEALDKEANEKPKKNTCRKRKRPPELAESELEDKVTISERDSSLPPDILDCIVVENSE